MLFFHILAGSLALLAGFAALFSPKGGPLHRRAGTVFAIAMLAMTATGATMAALDDDRGAKISVVAGLLAFGLVASGWMTVRPPARRAHALATALTVAMAATATAAWSMAALALRDGGRYDGMPLPIYAMFGTFAALAVLGDVRVFAGRRLDGRQRLARHLWRMGVAMSIATMSFFLGQADEFPAWLRSAATTAGPPLLVVGTVLGYFLKTLWRRRARRLAPAAPDPGRGGRVRAQA